MRLRLACAGWIGFLALLALAMAVPARAAQDVVHFGSTIDVAKGESAHDVVCLFCSVNLRGTARGDVVVLFGNVRIDGKADHDVVNLFGSVKAADDTSIGHDLVNLFGGVELGRNVTVGEDAVELFGHIRMADSASIRGSQVVELGWVFWGPFLLIALGISFVVREGRRARRRRFLRGF